MRQEWGPHFDCWCWAIPRGRARELDRALAAALPDGKGAEYLALAGELTPAHMASDGFHPGPPVYRAWGRAAARRIREAFAPE